jgi:anthranilate phosphoribosyltransferase
LSIDDFGLSRIDIRHLRNRSVEESIVEVKKLIEGELTPIAYFVAINSAMALRVAGKGENLKKNASMVLDHLSSGKIGPHIEKLVQASGGVLTIELPTT